MRMGACGTGRLEVSRWGHHGDSVVIFAPKFQSPGGRDVNAFFAPLVAETFQSLPNALLREPGVARRRLHVDVAQLSLHDAQVLRATAQSRATRMPETVPVLTVGRLLDRAADLA